MPPYLTKEKFDAHIKHMRSAPKLTIDTEGTLNHPFSQTWGVSYSFQGVSEYFAFNHKLGENLPLSWKPQLVEAIENSPCLVMHHAKHDLRALRSFGVDIKKIRKFYCTMMKSHMIDENRFSQSLDAVSRHYGGNPKAMPQAAVDIKDAFGWAYIPVDLMCSYAANDAEITEVADDAMQDEWDDHGFEGEYWDIEQDFTRLLGDIEDNGALIDQDLAQRELDRGLDIMKGVSDSLGFNPGSTTQLGKFLIDELGLPVLKRNKKPTKKHPQGTGNPSFDKEAMEGYDELLQRRNDTRARQILLYRGWQKTTSSNYKPYLELLHPDGRLRCNFKQHGTKTGRLSCELPNLQQIPKSSTNDWNGSLKSAFIVEDHRVAWEADYSQLEFRLGAAYGRVSRLIELFADMGRDVFEEMAKDLGMVRQDVKTLVYTLQFGGGVNRIKEVFGVSELVAAAIRDNFFRKYHGLLLIANKAQAMCKQNGYVKNWAGRRRHFRYPQSEAHKAFNAVIQGGAFEIVKRGMVRLWRDGILNDECRMDLQVHDSARFDIEEGKEHIYLPEIKRVMEDVQPDFGVKFKVDVHKWGTNESYDFALAA
jgi:DNA polymerase I-like protein with 3'-5' exonuclease and polymerase domains